jgi:hypothetical protein
VAAWPLVHSDCVGRCGRCKFDNCSHLRIWRRYSCVGLWLKQGLTSWGETCTGGGGIPLHQSPIVRLLRQGQSRTARPSQVSRRRPTSPRPPRMNVEDSGNCENNTALLAIRPVPSKLRVNSTPLLPPSSLSLGEIGCGESPSGFYSVVICGPPSGGSKKFHVARCVHFMPGCGGFSCRSQVYV